MEGDCYNIPDYPDSNGDGGLNYDYASSEDENQDSAYPVPVQLLRADGVPGFPVFPAQHSLPDFDHFILPSGHRSCPVEGFVYGNSVEAENVLIPSLPETHTSLVSCPMCNKSFLQTQDLDCHIAAQHVVDGNRFICPQCSQECSTAMSLRIHVKGHETALNYTCNICQMTFDSESQLKTHASNHHSGKKPHVCRVCGNSYETTVGLKRHFRVHKLKNKKSHSCDVCGRSFKTAGTLRTHRINHDLEEDEKEDFNNSVEIKEEEEGKRENVDSDIEKQNESEKCTKIVKHESDESSDIALANEHKTVIIQSGNQDEVVKSSSPICNGETPFQEDSETEVSEAAWEDESSHYQQELDASDPENSTTVVSKSLETKSPDENLELSFPCPICNKYFNTESSLKEHSITHASNRHCCEVCGQKVKAHQVHSHKSVRSQQKVHRPKTNAASRVGLSKGEPAIRTHHCPHCSLAFKNKTTLRVHVAKHANRKKFLCHVCNREFLTITGLKTHSMNHTGERRYLCPSCGKTFKTATQLKTHQRCHTDDKFICHICEKSYCSSDYLKLHIKTHTSDNPNLCATCGHVFTTAAQLRIHQYVHGGTRPFQCSICGRGYISQSLLQNHMYVHAKKTGDKTHLCTYCGQGFPRKDLLEAHRETAHIGEKTHECRECEEAFAKLEELKQHMISAHSDTRPHICGFCAKGFNNAHSLQMHLAVHTGYRPYKCRICHRGFTQPGSLKSHENTHAKQKPYQCEECGRGFSQLGNYKDHIVTHTGIKPYTCTQCGKGYSRAHNLRAHLLTHQDAKSFSCSDCGARFAYKKGLMRHMLKHIHEQNADNMQPPTGGETTESPLIPENNGPLPQIPESNFGFNKVNFL